MCAQFPRACFPDWWDIHTQKANHHNKLPNTRASFGNGRSMTADWGRHGSCLLTVENDVIHVHSQFSHDLTGILYRAGCPRPMLPVHYHNKSGIHYAQTVSPSAALFKDLGITHLLNDPVFGEQACAAFVCAKFMTFLNRNLPNLTNSDTNRRTSNENELVVNKTLDFLSYIDKFTTEVLLMDSQTEALRVALKNMMRAVKIATENQDIISRKKSERNRPRKKTSKSQHALTTVVSSIFRIPLDEEEAQVTSKYLGLDEVKTAKDPVNSDTLSELSCAVDPFLITLSARQVNPDFLGNGCLCRIGEQTPILLWVPPFPRAVSVKSSPKIHVAHLPNTTSFPLSSNQFTSIQMLDNFVGTHVCEIDAVQLDESSLFFLSRSTSGEICTSRIRFKLSHAEALTIEECENIPFDSRTSHYRPASVAISPWRIQSDRTSVDSLRWATAGRAYNPMIFSNSHLAIVELFDARLNKSSWCGRIPLNSEGESIADVLTNSVAASSLEVVDRNYSEFEKTKHTYSNSFLHKSLFDYCQQVKQIQKDGGFLSPQQLLYRAELDFRLSHASVWVRVGFADAPGLLCLTTPKRLLHIDTRSRGSRAAQELFNMAAELVDLDKGRSFNPFESIFHSQSHMYEDTYILLATDYNGLVLDKRMPGHPVLHWSHTLRGPLCYAEICDIDEKPADFPAQTALVTASQLPGEISITGIDFSRGVTLPPRAVGPSMTNGTLTDVLDCPLNNLPSGILDPSLCDERLSGGLVGSTAYVLRDQSGIEPIGIRGVMMTSRGDLFTEDWFFDEQNATVSHNSNTNDVRSWCLNFNGSNRVKSSSKSGLLGDIEHNEPIIPQKARDYEPLMVEDLISEFKRELPDGAYPTELFADLRHLLTEESVPTELSSDRESEEQRHDAFLDQIIDEASKKQKLYFL